MDIERNQQWLDEQWKELKLSFPIGHKFYGSVIRIEPFGIFVHLGYPVVDGYKLSGIIDIITRADHDSSGLPVDYSLWSKLNQQIHCKVIWYRETIKEVSLSLVHT